MSNGQILQESLSYPWLACDCEVTRRTGVAHGFVFEVPEGDVRIGDHLELAVSADYPPERPYFDYRLNHGVWTHALTRNEFGKYF
jgi:hypothetical protein